MTKLQFCPFCPWQAEPAGGVGSWVSVRREPRGRKDAGLGLLCHQDKHPLHSFITILTLRGVRLPCKPREGHTFGGDFTKVLHRFGKPCCRPKRLWAVRSPPTCFHRSTLRALTRARLHTPPTAVRPERPHLEALTTSLQVTPFSFPLSYTRAIGIASGGELHHCCAPLQSLAEHLV